MEECAGKLYRKIHSGYTILAMSDSKDVLRMHQNLSGCRIGNFSKGNDKINQIYMVVKSEFFPQPIPADFKSPY
ncbi:MAG: hypothetical protein FD166_1957 [Bacteroidetes bacterium]|nr:MAG: hypothetical protein FD166_1957 [Bacteroidota bacterium]